MEIGIKEIKNVNFEPPIEKDPEIIAAMSMAVVKIENYYEGLYREVKKSPEFLPKSVLAFVSSKNGIDFKRTGIIPVEPSKEKGSFDELGVEDPTIVKVDNEFFVFHSAVQKKYRGEGVWVSIQAVKGKSLDKLEREKIIILTPRDVQKTLGIQVDMVKEPEFFYKDGMWRMIFEHTGRGKSEIAIAESFSILGPYRNFRPLIETRENSWDSQHTSPGPILINKEGDILMFYNGRGPKNELDQTPCWAIGWAIIDGKTMRVIKRAKEPIIQPPEEIGPGNQLIAFANSIVPEKREHKLYFTIADKRSAVAKFGFDNRFF